MGGFLHHVAQRTGQLQLAGPVQYGALDAEHITARFGVRQPVDHAGLVLGGNVLRRQTVRSQIAAHILRLDCHVLEIGGFQQLFGTLAAQCGNTALQIPHTCLTGVVINDFLDCVGRDLHGTLVQPVLFELLGNQVVHSDGHLFPSRVGGQLDDFHPVDERLRNGVQRVGGGDEQTVGKIIRQFHKVVAEVPVLLRVKHLKKRRRRVSVRVPGQLVHLVQQDERVLDTDLRQCRDDASRHGADIGFPVPADVGLIPHAAQRHTDILALHGAGNGCRDGGLADTGRADKAENLVLEIRGELFDCHVFQNALLDLFEPVMIGVQHLARRLDVDTVGSRLVPRNLQAGIQIVGQHRRLGRAERELCQPLVFPEQLRAVPLP